MGIVQSLPGKIGTVTKAMGNYLEPSDFFDCKRYKISFRCTVQTEEEYYPITGIYNKQESIQGWKWDRSIAQDLRERSRSINTSIGAHYNYEEGLVADDWVSATSGGLEVVDIKERQLRNKRLGWFPVINTGVYEVFGYEKPLYGDLSSCEILYFKNQYLNQLVDKGSISICLYKRDNNFINIPFIKYKYNASLNEAYSFKLTGTGIQVDKVAKYSIGEKGLQKPDCHYEYLGLFNPQRDIAYTRFFPVKDISLFLKKTERSYIKLTKVNSFSKNSNEIQYILERETGKILFNNNAVTSKIVKSVDLNNGIIEFYESLEDIEDKGVVNGYNYIKDSNYRILIAEYLNNINLNQKLTFDSSCKYKEGELYAAYDAVPRIEYNIKSSGVLSSNKDVKPYASLEGRGIISLRVNERHISKITLSCDKEAIGDFKYKTLYVGNDSTILTAKVEDSAGNLIEEAQVFFESDTGVFDSFNTSVAKQTNLAGECFVNFSMPQVSNVLNELVTGGSNEITLTRNFDPNINLEDITVFQILKTDPFYGSLGTKYNVSTFGSNYIDTTEPILNSEEYITYQTNRPEDEYYADNDTCQKLYSNYGLAIVTFINSSNFIIKKKYIIENIINNRIFLNKNLGLSLTVISVNIFKRGELQFNPSKDNWMQRLVYYREGEAFKKVKATSISGSKVTLNKELPVSNLNSANNIIAGYKVYYPQYTTLRVYAVDPGSGNKIYSNAINILTDFPGYLKGVDGFRLNSDGSENESGLSGSNFITVNPADEYQLNFLIEV